MTQYDREARRIVLLLQRAEKHEVETGATIAMKIHPAKSKVRVVSASD